MVSNEVEVQMRHDHHYVSELHKRQNTTVKSKVAGERQQGETGATYCTKNARERSEENKGDELTDGPRSGDGGKECLGSNQEVGIVGGTGTGFESWSAAVDTPFIRQAGQLFLPICNHLSIQFWWKKCLHDMTRRSSSGS